MMLRPIPSVPSHLAADHRPVAAGKSVSETATPAPGAVLSVLMAVYDGEEPDYLWQCLQSLVSQTRPADCIVLVEDGPLKPELRAIIEVFRALLPMHSVALPANVGLATALNAGLPCCRGDVVARMDSDDIAHPRRFEKQLAVLASHPELDILGSFACELDEQSKLGRIWRRPVEHGNILRALWANPMIHPSVMMRRCVLQSLGGYDGSLRRSEDHELWFRAASMHARFQNIPEPLLFYRFSSASQAKQGFAPALERALVASRGARSIGLSAFIQLAVCVPLLRSFLPVRLRLAAYRIMQLLDPRLR